MKTICFYYIVHVRHVRSLYAFLLPLKFSECVDLHPYSCSFSDNIGTTFLYFKLFCYCMLTKFNHDIYLYMLWPFVTSKNNIDNQMCMHGFLFSPWKENLNSSKCIFIFVFSLFFILKRKLNRWLSTIPLIPKQTITSHFNHWTLQRSRPMWLEMQVLASDMHKNMSETNRLMRSNLPFPPLPPLSIFSVVRQSQEYNII